MPTPYGSRGGMAFSADELDVVRGALAIALQQAGAVRSPLTSASRILAPSLAAAAHLSEALEEANREATRMRAFLLADLARYRAALPGTATGYAELLQSALADGYLPRAADLGALRTLCSLPCGPDEAERRRTLLHRCERLAERNVSHRLRAIPGGRMAQEQQPTPERAPKTQPQPTPQPQQPADPARRPPTPAEVFPPRRPQAPAEQLLTRTA